MNCEHIQTDAIAMDYDYDMETQPNRNEYRLKALNSCSELCSVAWLYSPEFINTKIIFTPELIFTRTRPHQRSDHWQQVA